MTRSVIAVLALAALVGSCDKKTSSGAAADKAPANGSATSSSGGGTAAGATGGTAEKPADKPGWPTYTGPTFTVKHPREPETSTQDVPTAAGVVKMTAYAFQEPGGDAAYAVMTTPLPAAIEGADEAKMIQDARDGMVGKYAATLDKNADIKIGTVAALDFAAHGEHPQLGKFFLRGRVAVHNKTLYQVMALGAGHTQLPDAGTFVESFAFTP